MNRNKFVVLGFLAATPARMGGTLSRLAARVTPVRFTFKECHHATT